MINLMQRYNNFLIYANFRYEKWEILSKKIKNGAKTYFPFALSREAVNELRNKRTWMCAQRRYRKKKTQDTISGNGQRWAGGRRGKSGDNDVAKMHDERKETRSPKERVQDTSLDDIQHNERCTCRIVSGERNEVKRKSPYSMGERGIWGVGGLEALGRLGT